MWLSLMLGLPPQAPSIPQAPPVLQVVRVDLANDYVSLRRRVEAGERVLVASRVPAPLGFESIEIPGFTGLYECFLEDGKAKFRPVPEIRPIETQPIVFEYSAIPVSSAVCRT